MIIIKFLILLGIILFLFAFFVGFKTRRNLFKQTEDTYNGRRALQLTTDFWHKWYNNFIFGDPANLPKVVIVWVVIFFAAVAINRFYIRISMATFIPIFFVIFLYAAWSYGKGKNRKIFELEFPEIIQVMNASASASGGLMSAIEHCGKDVKGRVGEEFAQIHRRLMIGDDPINVFEESYKRFPYKEYYLFIMIIRLNMSHGGQMKEVMNRLGRIIADSKKMEQKKRAMTSEARMSATIVGALPVGFILFMQSAMPENFEFMMTNPSGRMVLYYVIGSEVLGFSIIYWLMKKSST